MRLHRLPVGRTLAGGAILVAVAAFLLWTLPSPDYLILPNTAQPLDGRVQVEGGRKPPGPGGIYYLDVTERQARWLEHIFAFARPTEPRSCRRPTIVPQGSSFESERRENLAEMQRSEQVAAAVALRQAGLEVHARLTGVLVESVLLDVPAAKVLKDGDVILSVDGKPTPDASPSCARSSPGSSPGRSCPLGSAGRATLVGEASRRSPTRSTNGRTIIGIYRAAQAADITLPINVDIDLGRVGGPSAGLPFALDVYEQLGHDVDHGLKVAATGELDLDGSVGPIGGVKQKTFGARRAGVDVFLVPAGENASEARKYAGRLRVIPVESFQQALRVLASITRK